MTTTIDQPYATGLTRANIERALAEAGQQTDALQASDLAMLEDFHSLGRLATAALIDLAQISESDRVLDAGAGIGGTARLIAAERGAHVTAVDLTPEYCEVAKWLNDAVGLDDVIEVLAADVIELPFDGTTSPSQLRKACGNSSPASNRNSDSMYSSQTFRPKRPALYATLPKTGPG